MLHALWLRELTIRQGQALTVETFGEKIIAEVTASAIESCDDMEKAS
jgi:hypothetical protein